MTERKIVAAYTAACAQCQINGNAKGQTVSGLINKVNLACGCK